MSSVITPEVTHEFLSSARIFAKAVRDVFEAAILREVAGDKLTFAQLKLLYLVAQADAVTIGDAAAFLGVTSPAASKSVEKLVRRRLLRRSDTQGERRTSQLSLTEASRRLLEAYETARNQRAAAVFAQYLPEEIQHTAELLDRLAAGISKQGLNQSIPEKDELCLQCEIYFRQECRFKEFGARHCFYGLHKNDQPDPSTVPAGSSELDPGNDSGQSKEG